MLFLYDDKKGVYLHPDAIKLSPELKKVKTKDLTFIVLAYDYKSIYRLFSIEEREMKAHLHQYGESHGVEATKKRLREAIEAYNDLQYDILRETRNRYQSKLTMLTMELLNASSSSDIKSINDSINIISKSIKSLDADIEAGDNESISLQVTGRRSFLELWQINKAKAKKDKEALSKLLLNKSIKDE